MAMGKLITIEGIDGAGKTTVAGGLLERLTAGGIPARLLREPGGVPAAERIRHLVKDSDLTIGDRAEALLYAAARAQLVEEAIAPALASGEWILLDRFLDSSLAYQGVGRQLGLAAVRAINTFGTGGLVPDRTLLLSIDPDLARARFDERGLPADRLEREEPDFFRRTAAGYRELAELEPQRFRVIDAAADPHAVLEAAMRALADLL